LLQVKSCHHMVNKYLIALGTNLPSIAGGADETLTFAIRLLEDRQLKVTAQSRFFVTPAFPAGAGPDFLNAAIEVETELPPDRLIGELHETEQSLGRTRKQRWAARVLDLDLLAAGATVLPNEKTFRKWQNLPLEQQKTTAPDQLILPHPRLHERAFVLVPLRDIAPDWRHPVLDKTVRQLVGELPKHDVAAVVPVSAK